MIFGREPAALVAALQAIVALLVTLNVLNWDANQVSLVMAGVAAVLGAVVAYLTKDTLLGYVITAINACAAVFVGFGLNLDADVTAGVVAVVTVLSGLYQRTQTSPDPSPSLALNPGV